MRDGGKGDAPRPLSVPKEVFDNNFDAIFGKKRKTDGCQGQCNQGRSPCTCEDKKHE